MEVLIRLKPVTCSMRLSRTRDAGRRASDTLSMRVILPRRDDVRTSDERSLRDAEWHVTFRKGADSGDDAQIENAVGQLTHLPALKPGIDDEGLPETCASTVTLDSATFDFLRDRAGMGKLPDALSLAILGIEFGWEPDGSGKVWDVVSNPNVAIKDLSIHFDSLLPKEADPADLEPESLFVQPSTESPELIAARATARAVEELGSRFSWAVGLLAVIAIILAFS